MTLDASTQSTPTAVTSVAAVRRLPVIFGTEVRWDFPVTPEGESEPTKSRFTLTRSGCDRLQEELKAAATALADVFPPRSKAALHLLKDWAFWTDLTEVPRGIQMQEGWFDKSKEAVVFKWETAPQNEEVGKFQKAALVVALKRKFHIV